MKIELVRSHHDERAVAGVNVDGEPFYPIHFADAGAKAMINGREYLAADSFGTISVDHDEPCSDPHVEANVAQLRERSAAGMKKYGKDLTRADLSTAQWLQHMREELLDGANYAAVLLDRIAREAIDVVIGDRGPPDALRWRHKDSAPDQWTYTSNRVTLPRAHKDLIIEPLWN